MAWAQCYIFFQWENSQVFIFEFASYDLRFVTNQSQFFGEQTLDFKILILLHFDVPHFFTNQYQDSVNLKHTLYCDFPLDFYMSNSDALYTSLFTNSFNNYNLSNEIWFSYIGTGTPKSYQNKTAIKKRKKKKESKFI